jgi:hypothetical protein
MLKQVVHMVTTGLVSTDLPPERDQLVANGQEAEWSRQPGGLEEKLLTLPEIEILFPCRLTCNLVTTYMD